MGSRQAAHDILIVQRLPKLPDRLRESLEAKGYPVRFTRKTEDLGVAVRRLNDPIILMCCAKSQAAIRKDLQALTSDLTIHPYPLIIIGQEVDQFQEELGKFFPIVVTLNAPASNANILISVRYIEREYPTLSIPDPNESATARRRRLRKEQREKEIDEPKKPEATTAASESKPPPRAPHEVVLTPEEQKAVKAEISMFRTVPDLLFEQLHALGILDQEMGGSEYPTGITLSFLKENQQFPKDRAAIKAVDDLLPRLDQWSTQHLARSCYIADRTLAAFKLPDHVVESARAATLLYPFAFPKERLPMLRKEYVEPKAVLLRKELWAQVSESARTISVDRGLPEVGTMIALVGKLMGQEEEATDDHVAIAASAIVAADITDRVCFQSGHWNPRRAHFMLRKIKLGRVKEIHPGVLGCIVKFLSEATAARSLAFLLPKSIRNDPQLLAEAKRLREMEIGDEENRISLDALSPGMRVSRPIQAFDGREILSNDVVLDQDLIWRIWQLSSIRPLNSPVVVLQRN